MPASERKTRIAVIGLNKGHQPHVLEKEFGDKLDLRFFTSNCSSSRLHTITRVSDVIVLMTKFISHNTQETIKEHLTEGTRFRCVYGGLSKLKQEISTYC